jgi:hypothetical protein
MTPEGLNSRLTFLNQCTRQGPQILDSTKPQNMVFGRPPICVLRIGDFYNTKIVVDSVNISYDPLQWDLNPEGIGVQPMLAKVTMSFKFIGGSSLGGPIKQLQNAVSYNFYANTGVYKPCKYTEKIIEQKQEKKDELKIIACEIIQYCINNNTSNIVIDSNINNINIYGNTSNISIIDNSISNIMIIDNTSINISIIDNSISNISIIDNTSNNNIYYDTSNIVFIDI